MPIVVIYISIGYTKENKEKREIQRNWRDTIVGRLLENSYLVGEGFYLLGFITCISSTITIVILVIDNIKKAIIDLMSHS